MQNIKFSKERFKFYLIFINIVFVGAVLCIVFIVSPRFAEFKLPEVSKTQIKQGAFFGLFLLFLFDFIVWHIDKKLSQAENQAQQKLVMNPGNQLLIKNIEALQKKRIAIYGWIEPILILVLGIFIAFISASIFKPLFELGLSSPK